MGVPIEFVTGVPIIFGTAFIALLAILSEIRNERIKRLNEESNLRLAYTEKKLPELKTKLDNLALRLGNLIDSDHHEIVDDLRNEIRQVHREMSETAKIQQAVDFEADVLNGLRDWSLITTTGFAIVTALIVFATYTFPSASVIVVEYGFLLFYALAFVVLARISRPYQELVRFERLLREKNLKKMKWRD